MLSFDIFPGLLGTVDAGSVSNGNRYSAASLECMLGLDPNYSPLRAYAVVHDMGTENAPNAARGFGCLYPNSPFFAGSLQ